MRGITKEQKKLIKDLQNYMQKRYLAIVRYITSKNAPNAEANIRFLIKNEPDWFAEIEKLREEKLWRKKRKEFNSINMQKTEIEQYMDKLENDIYLISDNINHFIHKEVTSPLALKHKTTHINNLRIKLDELITIQNVLSKYNEVANPPKPRGRPRKETDEKEKEIDNDQEELCNEDTNDTTKEA